VKLAERVRLDRFTTIGTGGPARFLARPASLAELQEAIAFAASETLPVEIVGLGSNLLVHDDGIDAVVLRLDGELAEARVAGDVLVAGGGATNAVCLHRARGAGLGGFEFASAIPGTVGGGVRMNAGAYGVEFGDRLLDVLLVDRLGARTVPARELELSYRHSALAPGQVVAQVRLQLEPRPAGDVKARVAELLAQRKATQPTTKRTFGSVFKNPSGESAGRLIEQCGLKGHRVGAAVISQRHANFIENGGGATSADCLALMAEARSRVFDRFGIELEHEVRLLGPLVLPAL
jgi:UDP-N-acetylenolpyruvoylglucosamine reductase